MPKVRIVAPLLAGLVIGLVLAVAIPVLATVTSQTRVVSYEPSSPTTTFAVPFSFKLASHLTVIKTLISTETDDTLVQGVNYTVTQAPGGLSGSITTAVAVTDTHRIRIERNVPYTQTTSLRSQGVFSPGVIEDALDLLVMMIQQLIGSVAVDSDIAAAISVHEGEADPHDGYALLAGRSGGQNIRGGTGPGESLYLTGTSHGTPGDVYVGDGIVVSGFDNEVGIAVSPTPGYDLSVGGKILAGDGNLTLEDGGVFKTVNNSALWLSGSTISDVGAHINIYGESHASVPDEIWINGDEILLNDAALTPIAFFSVAYSVIESPLIAYSTVRVDGDLAGINAPGGNLQIRSTHNDTKGAIKLGDASGYDDQNERLGIGTVNPTVDLDVRGSISGQRTTEFAGASYTVGTLANDCGGVIFTNSDNAVIQLPEIEVNGCVVTIINNQTTAGSALVSLSPYISDKIIGTCGAVTFTATINKDARNTKATSNPGDSFTVVSAFSANPGWYITGCTGPWAEES